MANSILRVRSDYQSKAFRALGLFCFLLLIQMGCAREFQVNWGLHNGTNAENYNQWAEGNRFHIGDSLVFNYAPNEDSVLHVEEDAYKNCSVEASLSNYTDGHTVFSFSHSGSYFFISGNKDHCAKNEKLVVVVMADRSNHSSTTNETNALSPSPSPLPLPSPPPSGSTGITPSPAPSAESPPPPGTNPTPAPSQESHPPPNAASSVFMSVSGSIGAFVASTLILAF